MHQRLREQVLLQRGPEDHLHTARGAAGHAQQHRRNILSANTGIHPLRVAAEVLGLAYVASGEKKYARAACERLASVSEWDPEGASYLPHNDEAHMSLVWHGPQAIDWVWDEFTDKERAKVIEQFKRRGEITYEFMHGHGSYGVTRFDSHAGREIVFLAQIALVLHEEIPAAREWLESDLRQTQKARSLSRATARCGPPTEIPSSSASPAKAS